MDNIKFSVIVPVYGVEKYIDQCVQSLLIQTYKNYELILVDDGSPDNCGQICDQYAEKDNRIRVVHKKNGGLSSARNAGLDIAKGEYVIFLDSDDFWDDAEALSGINRNLSESKADVLIFPAKRYYEESGKVTYILPGEVDRTRIIEKNINIAIEYLLKHNIYRAAAWNKVILRSLIEKYKMRFKEGVLSEDMDWCGDLLLNANRFDFYPNPFYCYRQQRAGSITSGKSEKLVADKLYMCKKGFSQAKECLDQKRGTLLASYYAYEYAVCMGVSTGIKNKNTLREMKNLQPLLLYDLCDKVKKVNQMRRVVGYELTRKVLCLFVKIKK